MGQIGIPKKEVGFGCRCQKSEKMIRVGRSDRKGLVKNASGKNASRIGGVEKGWKMFWRGVGDLSDPRRLITAWGLKN